ncbi:DUF4432 family protein [Flavobacteriaceae bacterium F89]|uniref:DUF4432 family protein n=1 Tax=Cerina litoralis TaxID=2874477 RepID=A0AAE3JR33_9FLAO|nr:DUF4432 family protein [Cerina litoralis]MCG2462781.1 DUF4432 family protein [Cerina litoralis]
MNTDCTINGKWTYNRMKVVYMENEFLKIGILVGRGSDIFQFIYKPKGIDLLLRLDKDILNPQEIFSQQRDTKNQFEDYYYGGWQEILPNSPPLNYRGAQLGQHGEVSLIPWDFAILNQSIDEVSLKVWTRPLRYPILIEKTLTLKRGSPSLYIDETLTNESNTEQYLMWGHHIAFGLPFLKDGASIETSATRFMAEEKMPEHRIFKPNIAQDWPMVDTVASGRTDASKIVKASEGKYSDLAYLDDFKNQAYYKLSTNQMSFMISWDKSIFKSLWYWQERYATQDSPWWGKTFAVALEPWTNNWSEYPAKTDLENDWLKLEPGQVLKTSIKTSCNH